MLRYLQIKKDLLDMISTMNPEQRMPDRLTLCKKLDTTRSTLDKAIQELVDEEVLVSRKGSGTYVANTLQGIVRDIVNWCVIIPNIAESTYGSMVKGIEAVAQEKNANIILCNSYNDSQKQEQYIRKLLASGVSGFIIVPVISGLPAEKLRLYNSLIQSKIPFVFCNRNVDGIVAPVVTSNDFYGGYIATKHLINNGYKNIGYIAMHNYRTSINRCHGYMAALMENDIQINRRRIVVPAPGVPVLDCYKETLSLLADDSELDAIFCFNDAVALPVINAITQTGRRVSKDIGIISYDNTEICSSQTPRLTSVSYKSEEIGRMAAKLLNDLCTDKPSSSQFEHYLFQPEIVLRESCLGPTK